MLLKEECREDKGGTCRERKSRNSCRDMLPKKKKQTNKQQPFKFALVFLNYAFLKGESIVDELGTCYERIPGICFLKTNKQTKRESR